MNLLTDDEGAIAVSAAVSYVHEAVTRQESHIPELPEVFSQKRGIFVTLTEHGELRGCIGYPYPVLQLRDAIKDAAYQAALHDPRFYPVTADELQDMDIEVTILSEPVNLACPANERPNHISIGKHGLIAEYRGHRGLLLPQVAVEWGWDSTEFLDQTCIKAGLSPKTWKKDACIIQTFEGQIFTRKQPWQ
ncbi:MAG TPA: TIGR00296 family protein [Methanocorpusculum sp.]|nr:TIGR00296 family protein [Methanocorpusculum sp.]